MPRLPSDELDIRVPQASFQMGPKAELEPHHTQPATTITSHSITVSL